jgi:osmoprotectant transport system permease protein
MGAFFRMPSDLQHTYLGLVVWHLQLALIPVVIGLVIALPIGQLCVRYGWLYAPVLGVATVFYAVPSLAFFVVLINWTGQSDTTVMIPLTVYTLVILIPAIIDGVRSVPDETHAAATAMGFGSTRRYFQVDLPIAVPAIIAGLRVAAVSSISLVSVGALIGDQGALGNLLEDATQYHRPILAWSSVISTAVLAIIIDGLLVLLRRLLTPWAAR